VSGRERVIFGLTTAVTAFAGVLHYSDADAVLTFAVSALALAGLAWLVAVATEQVGLHFGPAVTGFLQATLGNLPELFVVIFALGAGELLVAQLSLVGSILANALLIQGLVIVTGVLASDDDVMRFRTRLPQDAATLGLVTIFVIVVIGLTIESSSEASHHIQGLSIVGASCLLVVYGFWAWGYLRSDIPPEEDGGTARLSIRVAVGFLALGAAGAAFVSDWFIDALDPAVSSLGISKAFAGLVIVGIAGNAVEHVTSIFLAAKRRSDVAISVVKNSAAQVAAFLFPALVLISIPFDTSLTFAIPTVYIGALFVTAIASWQITGDGEARMFEGVALVAIYVVLAAFTLYD
jgi:Ca2+:H+ antiporter